jgi:PGF-CTERM protein
MKQKGSLGIYSDGGVDGACKEQIRKRGRKMMQKAIVNAFVVIIVVFAGMMSIATGSEISYDGTWVGNTSYGGVVGFNVSESMIKDFTISTNEACADLTDIDTGEKFVKCSGNLIITHTTFNSTFEWVNYTIPFKPPGLHFYDEVGEEITELIHEMHGTFITDDASFIDVRVVQNRFKYSYPPWETIEGIFTSAKNANGTWRKKTDSGILPNLICVYPPITWNATKVYAPTETPTPITPPEGKEVEVPSPTFKPSPTPTVTPVPLTPTPIPTPSPTATATEIPTPEEAVPGFEAIFAITGLLAVAYLLRRRK